MIKAVLLDMDNTLIATQDLFEHAHDRLATYLTTLTGIPAAESLPVVRRFEVELFSSFGYGTGMLPQAFENTLLTYLPRATEAQITEVRCMADDVYTSRAEVIPGVESALRELARHVPLYILTAGEQAVQQRRIDVLPFKDVFTDTFAVPEKNPNTYAVLLAKLGLKPDEVVMIGDSLKSDIIPAIAAGLSAIHIPHLNWFGREMAGLKMPDNKGAHSYATMGDAAAFLLKGKASPPVFQPAAVKIPRPPFAYPPRLAA